MKHLIYKALSFLLVLCLLCPLCTLWVSAASGSASIGLSARSVYVGAKVYVTVTYSSKAPMATWSFGVKYDTTRLEYVSGAHSTTGGTLNFVDQPTSGGVTSKSYTITFRATALGSASVSTVTREVYGQDYSAITISEASRTINIIERPAASTENRLSSLSVAGAELSPAFDAATQSYAVTVPYAVKSLAVTAEPKDASASVSVKGNEDLVVGENTVQVTVRAESGDTRSYTLTVTREDSPFFAQSVTLSDRTLTFPRDVSEVSDLPAGYEPRSAVYQDKSVLTFQNATGSVHLAVLLETVTDAENNRTVTEHLYLFDEQTGSFSPYVAVTPDPVSYVFLELPVGTTLPEGFSETLLVVNDVEVQAWQNSPEAGEVPITLVYATRIDSVPAFYEYQAAGHSFVRYRTAEVPLSTDGLTMEELEETLSHTQEELSLALAQRRMLFYIACGVVLVLLLILILVAIVCAVRRTRRRRGEDGDDPTDPSDLPPTGGLDAAVAAAALAAEPEAADGADDFSGPWDTSAPLTEDELSVLSEQADTQEIPQIPTPFAPPTVEATAPAVEVTAPAVEASIPTPPVVAPEPAPAPETRQTPAPSAHFETPARISLVVPEESTPRPSRTRVTGVESRPAAPKRRTNAHVDRVFGAASQDETFRKNNPPVDEDEGEDDAPLYGFDE